jgi:hypothetical protein
VLPLSRQPARRLLLGHHRDQDCGPKSGSHDRRALDCTALWVLRLRRPSYPSVSAGRGQPAAACPHDRERAARGAYAVLPAARIVAQRSPCLPVCYRCLTTQRSISTTAAAHAAMSTGTPAASASPAPSSAGPIANKSKAKRPATPMKAGLGKSFIAIGRFDRPACCRHCRLPRAPPHPIKRQCHWRPFGRGPDRPTPGRS